MVRPGGRRWLWRWGAVVVASCLTGALVGPLPGAAGAQSSPRAAAAHAAGRARPVTTAAAPSGALAPLTPLARVCLDPSSSRVEFAAADASCPEGWVVFDFTCAAMVGPFGPIGRSGQPDETG